MKKFKQLILFSAGLFLAAVVKAAGVSGANANVTVTSHAPGMDKIVPCGLEFHATTKDVPWSFRAFVDFKANAPQQLVEPNPSLISLRIGETATYRTSNPENIEEEVTGSITLFKVDVKIGLLSEMFEETIGAFIHHSRFSHVGKHIGALRPVRIRCFPANRPGNEKINLDFPAGDLLVKHGNTFEEAKHSYKVNEIGHIRFFLQGLTISPTRRNYSIKATHNINGCSDIAKYTVVGIGDPDYNHDDREDIDDDDDDDDDEREDIGKDDDDDERDGKDDDDDDDERDGKDDDDDDEKDHGRHHHNHHHHHKDGDKDKGGKDFSKWDWIWN